MKYKIKNIMAVGDVGKKLNLNKLAVELEYAEWDPEKFNALIYRIIEPTATFLIFKSGKFVCVGTSNEENLKKAIGKLKIKVTHS